VVNIEMHYNTDRLRPKFASFEKKSCFIMGNESSYFPGCCQPGRRVAEQMLATNFKYPVISDYSGTKAD
jgi:hypothetical protein